MTARTQRATITLPLPTTRPDHWTEQAACARPGIQPQWFDAPHDDETRTAGRARIAHAKTICARCPVTAACAAAVQPGDSGVRAGKVIGDRSTATTPRTRRDPKPITHGTANGAHGHRLHGERPCDACLDAERTYRRALRDRKAS